MSQEPLLSGWFDDTVHAFRTLVATPRYSLPAILSLALGIGASTAVFAIFSAVALRPLPFPKESELVSVHLKGVSNREWDGISVPYAEEFKELRSVFASFAAYTETPMTVTGLGDPRRVAAARVTPEFFDTLQAAPEVGRTFTAHAVASDGADVVVLSHTLWISAFGGEPVTGRKLLLDGQPKIILGVLRDDPSLPAHMDLWVPAHFSEEEKTNRFRLMLAAVGRLAPNISVDVAQQVLRAATERQNIRSPGDGTPGDGSLIYGTLSPLRDQLVGDSRTTVSLMLGAVAAFLLLACANVASLLVTRASVRSRELAVRAALGASPATLARQSGLEAALLTVVGSGAGLALSLGLVHAANRACKDQLAYAPARLDVRVLAAFVALALVSAFVVGVAPALHALRVRPMDSLRAEGRSSSSRGTRRLRESLVVLQVAATVALLVTAAVLVRSVRLLRAVDPGFDVRTVAARVLFAPERNDPVSTGAFARAVVERAEHLPGVSAAAVASHLPFDRSDLTMGVETEPGAPIRHGYARPNLVSCGYFQAMGIALVSGRAFSSADCARRLSETLRTDGVRVAIVSRAFARELVGTANAVGHKFHLGGNLTEDGTRMWWEIVGVAEDTLDVALNRPSEPAMYFPFTTETNLLGPGFALIARGSGDPDAVLLALTSVVREVDRDAPVYDADVLGSMVEHSYQPRTSLEQLLAVFAVASLLLACIGLFGVTSYTVAERSSEIGIRRALGADRGDILRMILGETVIVVGVGIALGLACAYSTRSLILSFLYGVAATDPATYIVVCIGTAAVAIVAALVPARAAASVPPSRALEVR